MLLVDYTGRLEERLFQKEDGKHGRDAKTGQPGGMARETEKADWKQ